MYRKAITYTDYDGNERTEDFYFNISKPELLRMQYSQAGGLSKQLERIVNSKDESKIMQWFEEIIRMSYGQKTDDGKRFVKSEELTDEFFQSEAYSEFIMYLLGSEEACYEFIRNVLPPDVQQESAIPAPPTN